jgi:predicted ATPase
VSGVTKIVLTGGPGSGKTAVAAALQRLHPRRYVVVPEAATQVYSRLNTRWDRLDAEGRRRVQRQIYQLQLEQEMRLASAAAGRVVLLDRGTVDGAAYWPEGPKDYWTELGTSHAAELARYDAVIWLQTCAAIGAYDGDASNACRHEDARAAIERGERVLTVWRDHPRLHEVQAFPTFDDKIRAVENVLL